MNNPNICSTNVSAHFHNIIRHSLDGILIINHNGAILFANPAASQLFGRSEQELSGMDIGFPITGNDRAELDIITPGGVNAVVEMRIAELEWQGESAFLTQLRDITERKKLEDNLRLAATVFENSPEGMIIFSPELTILSSNPAFQRLTGHDRSALVGQSFLKLWLDSQRQPLSYEFIHQLSETSPQWHREIRCLRQDGRYLAGWLSLIPVRDQHGVLTEYVAIFSELSQQKANEEALLLASVIFEQSAEGVCILDREERFLSVNRAFTDITGYSLQEVIGKTPRLLKSGHHDNSFYQAMWQNIEQQGRWQGEVWNRRKSGQVFPEWLSITAVRDSEGQTSHYIGIFSDISERKARFAKIERLAFHDPLTGLPNRTLLKDRIAEALSYAQHNHHRLGVIFLDLNRFKEINDTHGHDMGDKLLIAVAKRLQNALRQPELLARIGGDEFVVLVESASLEAIPAIAERLQLALSSPVRIGAHCFDISLSAGIACYPDHGTTAEELLKNADSAMYQAKRGGKGYCYAPR